MLMHLVLILTMLAPPSEAAADAAFNAGDYDGALALYLERAADPAVHRPDAYHGAHDSLLALHARTRDPAHLCRAHELARDLLTHGPFADDDERASWVEIESKDAARIKESGAACSPAASSEPVAEDRKQAAVVTVAPEGPAKPPAVREARSPRRPVARVAGGASLLAVGAGLVGGTAASLVGRARADASILALDVQATAEGRELSSSERAAAEAADRRYLRLTTTATVLGIASAVSLLTGLALLVAPPPRAAKLAHVRVQGEGLVYSF